ncbi:MAG TPA: ABC transporter permease [Vicinamibacterales bacterium]|jgi:predicted permease|nr:ABC transporter permease [Vicinamibacterales bacterium]
MGWFSAVEDVWRDLRHSVRLLARNPGFSAVAVAMLALGIAVNATVFTVTNAVLFKGFPLVERNDRLRYIGYRTSDCCVSYPDFLDWRAQSRSFSGMAIVHGVGLTLSDANGFAESLNGNENSADTFRLVGQKPIIGRDFTDADELPGAAPVAILNYGFWERRYGKDPSVIGRSVRMNGVPTTFVGVMPQGFSFPQTVDVWVPLVETPQVLKRENRNTWMVVARLAEGATDESARAEMDIIGRRLAAAYPQTNRALSPHIQTFTEFFIGPNGTLIYGSMWGAVGFVLLIACANLANLLLARAIGRSREMSVRIALGAGRWQIMRQLLMESVMLSSAGGFLGWWLAKWGVRTYQIAMAHKSSWLIVDYTMDHRVLGYLIAISIGTGLLFGLAPALRLSRLDVNTTLKDGARGATSGGRGSHLSALLVTGEMALAIVLLAGAGVMMRSFLKIHAADMGVNTADVLAGSISLPALTYPRAEQRVAFFEQLAERLQAIPGVESVTTASALPSWNTSKRPYELAGAPTAGDQPGEAPRPTLSSMTVSPAYFRTMHARLLSGRDFSRADTAAETPVAIVNQLFATKLWPGEDLLGKRLRFFDGNTPEPWVTVVGVVSNIIQDDQTRQTFDPRVYMPFQQKPGGGAWVCVRTRVPPERVANAFRHEVQALDPELPIYGPFPLTERLEMFWDTRFYGVLFLIFATLALLLASVGLYSVIAHSVSLRTQEIGIRMAIGASARDVVALVLVQGMIPLGAGLAVGLAASLAVNRVLQSVLVQVSPSDPITLAGASTILLVFATLGCLIPARRALRVDPVVALRHD